MTFQPANPFTTHIHEVEPGTVIKLRPGDETGIAVERGKPVIQHRAVFMVREDFEEVRRQTRDWSAR